jgi:phosphoribosylaminoimidazole carboxylase (NCAIR synthetase)
MVNLIGTGAKGVEPPTTSSNSLWWYAKESKDMRKLGHVTGVGDNSDEVLSELLRERKHMFL